jgi:CRP-like cAMP-binding protein
MQAIITNAADKNQIGLDQLSEACRTVIEAKMSRRTRAAGDVLFYEDDPCDGVHFVISGLIGLRKSDADGNSVLLRLAYGGDFLGCQSVLTDANHTVEAEVLEDAETGFISRDAFLKLVESSPEFALHFLRQTAGNLAEVEFKSFEYMTKPARARVAHFLWSLKDRYTEGNSNGATSLRIPFGRKDMAALLGITPETISRVIRVLSNDGVAKFTNRTVSVPNLDSLHNEFAHELAA